MNQKKSYQAPELEVLRFENENVVTAKEDDVIYTSNTLPPMGGATENVDLQ